MLSRLLGQNYNSLGHVFHFEVTLPFLALIPVILANSETEELGQFN